MRVAKGRARLDPSERAQVCGTQTRPPTNYPDQHEFNVLLARISEADRDILARMLQQAFEGGVHATLVALHEAALAPFDRAYEGTPFHDFVGRLAGWTWPSTPRT